MKAGIIAELFQVLHCAIILAKDVTSVSPESRVHFGGSRVKQKHPFVWYSTLHACLRSCDWNCPLGLFLTKGPLLSARLPLL